MEKLLKWFGIRPKLTIESIRKSLPLRVAVTKDMIIDGTKNIGDSHQCIGAQLLKGVFGIKGIRWAWYTGSISIGNQTICFTTEENLNIAEIINPQIVTLIELT